MTESTYVEEVNQLREQLSSVWPLVARLNAYLHAHVEPTGNERQSCSAIVQVLRECGMEVEVGHAGLATSFVARAGGPAATRVAFLCEYDGLPPYGHSCGHNVVSSAAVAAALTLLPLLEVAELEVVVVGTPEEEGRGGKVDLADAGVFDGVDACMLIYPGMDDIASSRTLHAQGYVVTLAGQAAHAAAHPELGASALDALVAGYMGTALLRQTLPPEVRVHTIITEGGVYPQVIPDRAQARVVVRGSTPAEVQDTATKVRAYYQGAATAHHVQLTFEESGRPSLRLLENPTLARLFESSLQSIDRSPVPTDMQTGAWSSDAGYLSRYVPVIQPQIAMTGRGVPPHSHEFHAASHGAGADSAIEAGALAMGLTALALSRDATLRRQVREDFQRARTLDPVAECQVRGETVSGNEHCA